ncbi:BnaC09g53510D [Brassica napus]|uniref:BnaC09g53510D protein n=2 Tax=Brassica TaxID=3705 RepID=A0A078JGA2_BRANA|nr:BnaC09g53510D [Brassica napus]
MAPRKLKDDQLEEIRLMLEAFTPRLQAALQTSVTTALQTILQDQHNQRAAQGESPLNWQQHRSAQLDASDDEGLVENVFADHDHDQQGQRAVHHNERLNVQGDEHDHRANQPNLWETSFRSDIPEFHGTLNPEDFIDWLNTVEEILEFRQVPNDVRVFLVATRFKGRAIGLVATTQRV